MEPRKRLFQVHLSTAVILMFTAGVVMWANFQPSAGANSYMTDGNFRIFTSCYGWPWWLFFKSYLNPTYKSGKSVLLYEWYYSLSHALADLLVALAILTAAWWVCEWWIRFRKAGKRT